MAKVALKTRAQGSTGWESHQIIDYNRIPSVGEYVSPTTMSGWFEVRIVVHCPFPDTDCDAEVYAVEANQRAVLARHDIARVGAG
ncbi:MAG TPA: hypothetical protein VEL76_04175 [Gemmataceae bacterium]|nr:hypothetical protein [Gemmataceae bacterium]